MAGTSSSAAALEATAPPPVGAGNALDVEDTEDLIIDGVDDEPADEATATTPVTSGSSSIPAVTNGEEALTTAAAANEAMRDEDDDEDEERDSSDYSDEDGSSAESGRRRVNGGRRDGGGSDCRFDCNICLDPVSEPVVTRCGHLFCWPCLYRWLEPGILPEETEAFRRAASGRRTSDPRMEAAAAWHFRTNSRYGPHINESRRVCPVCKAECTVPTVIPIYVRTEEDDDAPPPEEAESRARSRRSRRSRKRRGGDSEEGSVSRRRREGDEGDRSATDETPETASRERMESTASASTAVTSNVEATSASAPPSAPEFGAVSDPTASSGLRRRYPLRMRRDPDREAAAIAASSSASDAASASWVSPSQPTFEPPPPSSSSAATPYGEGRDEGSHPPFLPSDVHSPSREVPSRPPPPPMPRSPRPVTRAGGMTEGGAAAMGGPRPASLSNGMALAFHQGLFQALVGLQPAGAGVAAAQNPQQAQGIGGGGGGGFGAGAIPPIHQLQSGSERGGNGIGSGSGDDVATRDLAVIGPGAEGGGRPSEEGSAPSPQPPVIDAVDATTEFLSRLLLMLGSFVILCLLLF